MRLVRPINMLHWKQFA